MTVSADGIGPDSAHSPERIDTLFRVLSDRRRRIVLRCLDGEGRGVDELARRVAMVEGTASGRSAPDASLHHVRTALEHQHLPKLVHAGLVEWHRTEDRVELTADAAAVRPLLEFGIGDGPTPSGTVAGVRDR
jgi:DNA-binding transcriptional ArsR family regulator